MCKRELVCYRGHCVGLLFRGINQKREEQNNRSDHAVLMTPLDVDLWIISYNGVCRSRREPSDTPTQPGVVVFR